MNIKRIAVDELKEFENNPRRIPQKAVEAVVQSISEYGYKNPIIVTEDNIVVSGHTRLKALKQLGVGEVVVVVVEGLTAEQVRAYRIADNKTAERADWSFEKLAEELRSADIESDLFDDITPADGGFSVNDFDDLLNVDITDNTNFIIRVITTDENDGEALSAAVSCIADKYGMRFG